MVHLGNNMEVLGGFSDNSIDAIVTDPPYGLSFMSKKWDYDVPSVELWQECLRVLKPGGHLLAFAGTRTQHRMACRIEDAGFEIRDMIAWVYGSGFPKSLNIGKAVDKLQGNERECVGENPNYRPISGKEGYLGESNFRQTDGMSISTKGHTEYEGLGTALKPALEPITLARKPISEKSIAENVLKWGTGGIEIDGCRVDLNGQNKTSGGCKGTDSPANYNFGKPFKENNNIGRFPANLIHDGSDEVLELFPMTSNGKFKSGTKRQPRINREQYGDMEQSHDGIDNYGDTGSAARFFYCAKSSPSERNKGLDGFENEMIKWRDEGQDIRNVPYKLRTQPRRNHHPTVKPIKLMEYLVKLISREGQTVLDPFMGSGSTGIACKNLNREFIGIELNEEYFKIAEARINC